MRTMLLMVLALISFASIASSEDEKEEYWNDWRRSAKEFSECKSQQSVKGFLISATNNLENSERTESNAEVIEVLILRNPDCFCAAYNNLDKFTQQNVTEFFVKIPRFFERKEIEKAIMSTKTLKPCIAF